MTVDGFFVVPSVSLSCSVSEDTGHAVRYSKVICFYCKYGNFHCKDIFVVGGSYEMII